MPPGFTDVMSSPSQGAGSERFSDLYPLTFGKIVAPVTIPIEVESLGISMVGVYDMVGAVDAWGKVAVPAGMRPGQTFKMDTDAGPTTVKVPPGFGPGQEIEVKVPMQPVVTAV